MEMDVIGFGALNLDRLYRVERIAREGEHMPIEEATESPGGSAANTIAALAGLGLKTGFIGAAGNDAEGKILLEDFEKREVDTKGIAILPGKTGVIIGFVDAKGERTLYPYPGANSMMEEKDIDFNYAKSAKFLHITSFVGEKQFGLQKKLASELTDTCISFSPGDLYTKKGLRALLPIIKKSAVIFLNETEIKDLTGKSYAEGSRALTDKGARIVAVTLGAKGCFVSDGKDAYHVPAKKAKVADTTGAGDAFAAGFLHKMIRGGSILDAARSGNDLACLCIKKVGARTWLPEKRDKS